MAPVDLHALSVQEVALLVGHPTIVFCMALMFELIMILGDGGA